MSRVFLLRNTDAIKRIAFEYAVVELLDLVILNVHPAIIKVKGRADRPVILNKPGQKIGTEQRSKLEKPGGVNKFSVGTVNVAAPNTYV